MLNRCLTWRQIFLTAFCIISLDCIGQIPGILDIRNEVRTLRLKNAKPISPNISALPIFESTSKAPLKLNFVPDNNDDQHYVILQDDDSESYLMLSNVDLKEGEFIKFESIDNFWNTERITQKRLSVNGNLFVGPFRGDITISKSTENPFVLHLNQVYSNPVNIGAMELGFDASFECHININCDDGRKFVDEKRSVMRIRMVAEEGVALCTGTLMNNTREDQEPYVLTAYHCIIPPSDTITPLYDMWLFDFNYESFSCADPESEPIPAVVQGAQKLAEWEDTDMMLLRMTGQIPEAANVYFAGWNKSLDYLPDSTFLIHHPVGDIKKISIDIDTVKVHERTIGWNNGSISPEFSHYINDFDLATYQPGSSGAAIFDPEGLVLGQLHGGPLSDESCTLGIGYSGRVSVSWDTGDGPEDRLRDWLDPDGIAGDILEGKNAEQNEVVRFTGNIKTPDGLGIPNVRVTLTGDQNASFLTGSDGRFVFENLNPDGLYLIEIEKNTNFGNGLSATDLVIIKNHILASRTITDEFVLKAVDVNQDGNISSTDLVQIKNVIIGSTDRFPRSPSWDFEPNELELGGNSVVSTMEINIIGFKIGDANYSAKPGN